MTDIKQCPSCGEIANFNSTLAICKTCGYNNSMLKQYQYTLTITAVHANNGTITGATTGDKYPEGTAVTLTFNENSTSHIEFLHWHIDRAGAAQETVTSAVLRLIIRKNTTVTATYAAHKALTIAAFSGGSVKKDGVTVDFGNQTVSYHNVNAVVTMVATPAAHYEFTKWADDDANATHAVTMDGNKTMTPTFGKIQRTLTTGVTAVGGSLDVATGSQNEADNVTVTCTPATGYGVDYWVVAGVVVDSGNAHTHVVIPAANITCYCVMKKLTYTVTVGTLTNCTLTINGTGKTTGQTVTGVEYGAGITCVVTPGSGFHTDHWTPTNTVSAAANTLITIITQNTTVTPTMASD